MIFLFRLSCSSNSNQIRSVHVNPASTKWGRTELILLSRSSRSFSDSTPPRPADWLTRCSFTACEWWRGKRLSERASLSLLSLLSCWYVKRPIIHYTPHPAVFGLPWSFENENEGGAESDWLSWERAFHDSIHCYRKLDWTNKQTILNDSSWRTDRRELNQGKESLNPSLLPRQPASYHGNG